MRATLHASFFAATISACSGGSGNASPSDASPEPDGGVETSVPPRDAPELGTGDHSAASVTFVTVAGPEAGLKTPRDLAFNPRKPDELWVVNLGDESVTIVHDASTDGRTTERRKDGYALHFMARPASIAFGADETTFGIPGTFATCGESRNTYDDTQAPNDFMGPALWSSDLSIFAKKNPNGLGSHLDMLHNSSLCVGVAHEDANIYWTFAGKTNAIVKYDFHSDNGIGNDDHSDGESWEYVRGQVRYASGIPSHLEFDPSDGSLYIADTGNARVAKLDTKSGVQGISLPTMEPMAAYHRMNDATIVDFVSADSGLVTAPSGLELHSDWIYVSDDATSRISAFSKDGTLVNWLDTGLDAGALAGMAFGADGKLYFVDMLGSRVLRVDPI